MDHPIDPEGTIAPQNANTVVPTVQLITGQETDNGHTTVLISKHSFP
jgi:hypothetical protein